MKTKTGLKAISALIMTSALVACGGGSDGGSGVTNNAFTAESVTSKYTGNTKLANLNRDNAADFANSAYSITSEFADKDDLFSNQLSISNLIGSLDQIPSMSQNCDLGSLNIENSLTNGLGSLSITFNNCQTQSSNNTQKINGKMQLKINSLDAYGAPYTYSSIFSNFAVQVNDNSTFENASTFIHGENKVVRENEGRKSITNLVNSMASSQNASDNENVMVQSFTVIEKTNSINQKEYSMSGEFYDATQGKVNVSTVKPLIFSSPNLLESGSFVLTGNNNSKVKVEIDNYVTSLHVDADGDDSYEYTAPYFRLESE
ncbi:hypothetical protein [Photobacterium sp. J15]|uniref:hypothetical protein n=1 Tax=Photobacterium sp. J15 TaxID=265901 RepID=UPI0007E30AA8|nr:hypothetical protein [Photobacterium sp. J15]